MAQKFNLLNDFAIEDLVNRISEKYEVKTKSEPVEYNFEIYDTFDWRLFGKSLVLRRTGDNLYLRNLGEQKTIASVKVNGRPVFGWNLPAGKLKNTVMSVIEIRALLNLAKVTVCAATYPILNEDEKIVARLIYEEARVAPGTGTSPLARTVQVQPVRGYTKEANALVEIITTAGLALDTQDIVYLRALESRGKKPGDYSAKRQLSLNPDMRADEATRKILRQLLEIIRTNEPYIKQDIDTEFLHDFRVAVRRTRSALSQIQDVFSPELTRIYNEDFAYVGKFSNQLRDLDVYMLSEQHCKDMLPDILRQDIEPLFDYLRQKRADALQSVINQLDATKYSRLMEDWTNFLVQEPVTALSGPNGERPIIELARNHIYKRYRRIIKSGKRILKNTEDKQLHSLRIECKKLRYLLEFFASLFPADKVNPLIMQLKNLQNNLGDFNDLCVQEAYLINLSTELPATIDSRRVCLAIGSLIGTLDGKRARVKNEFAQAFNAFATPQNKQLFKALFAPDQGEK